MVATVALVGLAVLVALTGLALTAAALFRDPLRRLRRCPKCWYDMSATIGMMCSECGHTAPREPSMFRIRRRWRTALLGLCLFLLPAGSLVAASSHAEF